MLGAILNKSWRQQPTKQQLYGHLPPIHENYQNLTNQTRGTLLEKKERTYKRFTLVDLFTWLSKDRATRSNLHTAALCRYGMKPCGPAGSDERLGGVAREGQGYPYWWQDMMMMMMILKILSVSEEMLFYNY